MQTSLPRHFARFKTSVLASAVAALALFASPAFAAHDLPAGDINSPVASPFPTNFNAGNLLASTSSTVTPVGGAWTGTFRSAVYSATANAADQTASAAFLPGAAVLDFVYQFSNSAGSNSSVGRLSMFDFSTLDSNPNEYSLIVWDQAADPDGAGMFLAGNQESENADRGSSGSVVGITYGSDLITANKINPGETGWAVLVRVNTTNYTSGTFSAINGGGATVLSYAPAPAIPEPETYALMLAGLGVVGFMARRRKNV